MAHKKQKYTIPAGGQVVCGSRKMRLDAVDANGVASVTLTKLKGEAVEVRDPKQRDAPWIGTDDGEGNMTNEPLEVKVGHKIRVGMFRQFRVLSFDGTNAEVVVVGPVAEIDG